jgi:hypothetical protein
VPDRFYPEWDLPTSFITQHLFSALALDAQRLVSSILYRPAIFRVSRVHWLNVRYSFALPRSSHPIEVEIADAQLVYQCPS